jgi:hypothetical protein
MHDIDFPAVKIRSLTAFSSSAALALSAAAALTACAARERPAVQTAASKPTVSYEYAGDEALLNATRKAEAYCAKYGAWPTAEDFDDDDGVQHVTFACNQPRSTATSTTVVTAPSPPPLTYPYRDDRGLVEALNQAQRYCVGLNSSARSTRVTDNPDGSRTVTFECEHL